jgi:hypothetical protein
MKSRKKEKGKKGKKRKKEIIKKAKPIRQNTERGSGEPLTICPIDRSYNLSKCVWNPIDMY